MMSVAVPDEIGGSQTTSGKGREGSTSSVLGSRSGSSDIASFFRDLGVEPTKEQMHTAYKWKVRWIKKAFPAVS